MNDSKTRRILGILMGLCLTAFCILMISKLNPYTQHVEETIEESNSDNIYTMQIGHAHGVTSSRHIALKMFKKLVEDRTNGEIIVNIFPNGQLGTEQKMHEEVEIGTLQAVWGGEFDILPKLIIFTLPFLCNNEEEMYRLIDSEMMKEICAEAERKGIIVLGVSSGSGFRQLSNNVHPIRTPDDIKGLRMRVNNIDTIGRTMKALGAQVVSIPYNNLYSSLKEGKVDGEENPWANIESKHFYEVQDYFTEINYQFHPNPFYINLKWYQSLPKEYQEVLSKSVNDMVEFDRYYDVENRKRALKVINSYADVYVLTQNERQAFRDAVQIVYDQYIQEGILTQGELDRMKNIMSGKEK